VIPNAVIKVTQADTGQVRSTPSGTDASYVLPNLPVGPYRLEASAQGFNSEVSASSHEFGYV